MADTPAKSLAGFIARYAPEVQRIAKAALRKMRARLPGACELVYENYNALAIGFGPTDETGDLILSITLYPRWVSLFFPAGATLDDPRKLLQGSGKKVRHIVLEDASTLDKPDVEALIAQAVAATRKAFTAGTRRRTIIKMVVAKTRPRRP
jgi:hypothetical protein